MNATTPKSPPRERIHGSNFARVIESSRFRGQSAACGPARDKTGWVWQRTTTDLNKVFSFGGRSFWAMLNDIKESGRRIELNRIPMAEVEVNGEPMKFYIEATFM